MMDIKRIERSADKILDAFSDLRVEDHEIMYVAMYVVMKATSRQMIERVVDFGEQVKWELNHQRKDRAYVQDQLF